MATPFHSPEANRFAWFAGTLLLTLLLTGCTGTRQSSINGEVTFAGEPVEEGSISFLPEADGGRRASAAIIGGKYVVPADQGPMPGRFRVEIVWDKKTGRTIPSTDPGILIPERQQVIPAKYNTASTLVRDISAGENKLDFTLEP